MTAPGKAGEVDKATSPRKARTRETTTARNAGGKRRAAKARRDRVAKAGKAGKPETQDVPKREIPPAPAATAIRTNIASRAILTREALQARKEEEIGLMLRLLQEAKTGEGRRRVTLLRRRRAR